MKKVKDLSLDTPITGLHVRIPSHLRASTNLLNKGIIIGFWDNSHDSNKLPQRQIGVWLSPYNKKRSCYPCFLTKFSDLMEFQVIEEKNNKPQLGDTAIRNTTNITS